MNLKDFQTIAPIFIVGSPRSGTTVVTAGIEHVGGGYVPHAEGHLMYWLLEGVDKVMKNTSSGNQALLPTSICQGDNFQKLLAWLARCIDGFEREVAGEADGINLAGRWIDKTPDVYQLRMLPTLQKVFPLSQTVFMYRHPRDVALSTLNVWPGAATLEELLERWRNLHREYRESLRPQLDMKRVLEIKHEELVSEPDSVAKNIVEFLRLDQDKQGKMTDFFVNMRINRASVKSKDDFAYDDQATLAIIATVNRICGAEMTHWGYDPAIMNMAITVEKKNAGQNLSGTDDTALELKCWCSSTQFAPFSPHYLKCNRCGSLVSKAKASASNVIDGRKTRFATSPQTPNIAQSVGAGFSERPFFSAAGPLEKPLILSEQVQQDLHGRCLHWLKTLLKYKVPSGSVLTVGAAAGSLTALLKWVGFTAIGLEMSAEMADYIHRTFGVPVLTGLIETQSLEPGSQDVIILINVFERWPDPVATIGHCLELLKPDGLIIIQTPTDVGKETYEEMLAKGSRHLGHLKEKEYLHLFSRRAVVQLFEQLGCSWVHFEPDLLEYDMLFAVSRTALPEHSFGEIFEALSASPSGWQTLALLGLREIVEKEKAGARRISDEKQATIESLKYILQAREEELTSIKPVLQAREEELASIKPVLQAREEELASIKPVLQAREEELTSIKPVLQAREEELATYKNSILGQVTRALLRLRRTNKLL